MADAISIEETNRIRLSLGMKPLPVPGAGPVFKDESASDSGSEEASTLETREAQGTANWQRLQDEAERKRQKEARNEAIKKARDRAKRFERLEGKGLGEPDDEELDTKTWLQQQKKRQKKLEKERTKTKRLEEELQQREEQAYTAKDLAGVKVAHRASEFDETAGDQILTLKDATIDEYEEEGDELENVQLRETERRDERLNLLKRKPAYDPNADENEEDRTVLKQYDEVIDGKKRQRFTLGAEGIASAADIGAQPKKSESRRQAISLDILKDVVTSDYQEPKEVTFKKPKKSKKKSTRQKVFDDDDIPPASASLDEGKNDTTMDIDRVAVVPSRQPIESFIDDDDLQASLARTRKEALKKRKKLSAKEIARQIQGATGEEPSEQPIDDEPGLVIDETSEFVANLRPEDIESRSKQEPTSKESPMPKQEPSSDDDVDMAEPHSAMKDEPTEEAKQDAPERTETGLDADIQLNQGLGSTLKLLQQRGLVERNNAEELAAHHRDRQRFLAEKRRREEAAELRARQQRERDRTSGKLDRMSAREREEHARWENKHRDQLEARQMADIFNREYKPTVELTYVDEHGRHMDPKEAFKHLSHQFHGKGSGKQKTEKRLKKIEEEKKNAAQNVLGTGQTTGLNNAIGSTAKKTKQAGVRLG